MKYAVNTFAAAAVALIAAAPAFADNSQLAASAGLTQAQAQSLSLSEIAQAKFNNDTRHDDRIVFVVPATGTGSHDQLAAAAGLTPEEAQGMSVDEIFVAKINRESRGDEQQAVKGGSVSMATRSPVMFFGHDQLVASAGLSAEAASGLTLSEIAAAKFARDTSTGDN